MNSEETRPVNLGNPDEFTIRQFSPGNSYTLSGQSLTFVSFFSYTVEFAEAVREIVEKVQKEKGTFTKRVEIIHKEIPTDDPTRRRPDTTRAKAELKWEPNFTVLAGVEEMVRYYDAKMAEGSI